MAQRIGGRVVGRVAIGLALATTGLLSFGCTPSNSTAPPSEPPSPTPSPTPVSVDVGAAALKATKEWLADNGFTVTKTSGYYLTYSDGGGTFTSKVTCEGGQTTHIGWQGVCAAPNEESLGVIVAVRVLAGPKTETVAMESDVAASCGDETMPAWVTTALKTAAGEYCFLNDSDG